MLLLEMAEVSEPASGLKCTEAVVLEASTRAKADQALKESIREVVGRIAAVEATRSELQTTLDKRVEALVTGSNINLTTLVELIAAYESADTNVLTKISAMQLALDALTARVDSLP